MQRFYAVNVGEAIVKRRSIQDFDPNHTITQEEIHELIQASILSPSAFNIQHWRFVHVSDPALRQQMRDIAWNQVQVTEASALIMVCMDINAWDKQPERYCANTPKERQAGVIAATRGTYADNEQLQRDEAFRSASLASMTLILKAQEMGYESCVLGGFDFDKAAGIIKLPDDHAICMMITLGKALKPAFPRAGQLPMSDVLFNNTF